MSTTTETRPILGHCRHCGTPRTGAGFCGDSGTVPEGHGGCGSQGLELEENEKNYAEVWTRAGQVFASEHPFGDSYADSEALFAAGWRLVGTYLLEGDLPAGERLYEWPL